MKLLWDNYLIGSTITASSEDTQFPTENLVHKFLEMKYQALASSTTLTITMPEDKTVSMIAYGFNNVIGSGGVIRLTKGADDVIQLTKGAEDIINLSVTASYELRSSSNTLLLSGTLETDGDVNINYMTPTECRKIVIKIAANEGEVYIGGLSVGDPLDIEYIGVDPELPQKIRGDSTKTEGGQVLGKGSVTSLREWSISVPLITNDKRLEIADMIQEVGSFRPFFADLYEDSDIEDPMYCNIIGPIRPLRKTHRNQFSVALILEEAR